MPGRGLPGRRSTPAAPDPDASGCPKGGVAQYSHAVPALECVRPPRIAAIVLLLVMARTGGGQVRVSPRSRERGPEYGPPRRPCQRCGRSDAAVVTEPRRFRRPLLALVLDLLRGQIQHDAIGADALDRRLREIDLVEAAKPVLEQAWVKQEVVSAPRRRHIHSGMEDLGDRSHFLAIGAENVLALEGVVIRMRHGVPCSCDTHNSISPRSSRAYSLTLQRSKCRATVEKKFRVEAMLPKERGQ